MAPVGKLVKKRHAPHDSSTTRRLKRAMQAIPQNDIFPFLALPAELRNAIYEYCRSEVVARPVSGEQLCQNPHANGAIQLLHLNRQIRSEFQPVLLDDFHFHGRLEHLSAIVKLIEGKRGSPSGTVLVYGLRQSYIDQKTVKRSIDIAPLLRFCMTHHKVKLETVLLGLLGDEIFAPPSLDYIRELNIRKKRDTLGRVQKREVKWAAYFEKAVKEIWVTPRDHILVHHRAHFRVVVKPSRTEWWMGWSSLEPFTRAAAPPNLLSCKERTGYPGPCHKDLLSVCGAR